MKRGFTLVEISIVLVIIGLLIGGVLAAQSMVETAKVNKIIQEYKQFDIATSNFRENYKQWPGDYNNAIAAMGLARQGDGNGVLGNGSEGQEVFDFFLHLSNMGMISKSLSIYTIGTPALPVIGAHVIEGKAIKGSYWLAKAMTTIDTTQGFGVMPWFPYMGYASTSDQNKNFLVYAVENTASGYNTAAGIPVLTAIAVDTKIDDGLHNRGSVRGGAGWMGSGAADCLTDPSYNFQALTSVYNRNSVNGCALLFEFTRY